MLEGDSRIVISWIMSEDLPQGDTHLLLLDNWRLNSIIISFVDKHVFREANRVVDRMASSVVEHSGFKLWESSSSLLGHLQDVLMADASGYIYYKAV